MSEPGPGKPAASIGRSSRAEVRNPVLLLPAFREILDQVPADQRRLMGTLLRQLADEAAAKGDQCWARGKAMMGAYWRVVAVYSRHIAHAIDRRSR